MVEHFAKFWPHDGIPMKAYGPVFTIDRIDYEEKLDGDIGIWTLKIGKKNVAPHRYIPMTFFYT